MSSPKSQEPHFWFFLPRDGMTSLWECQWTKLHCHFRIKVLGHNANSSDIFWVGSSWSASGLKWSQVHLLIVCQGCVFNIQVAKEWILTDKIWQINICFIRYFSVYTQSTAFLHVDIISDVGVGLLPKVIWWTARQKLFRRDGFFCVVSDTEGLSKSSKYTVQKETEVKHPTHALMPTAQQ